MRKLGKNKVVDQAKFPRSVLSGHSNDHLHKVTESIKYGRLWNKLVSTYGPEKAKKIGNIQIGELDGDNKVFNVSSPFDQYCLISLTEEGYALVVTDKDPKTKEYIYENITGNDGVLYRLWENTITWKTENNLILATLKEVNGKMVPFLKG